MKVMTIGSFVKSGHGAVAPYWLGAVVRNFALPDVFPRALRVPFLYLLRTSIGVRGRSPH